MLNAEVEKAIKWLQCGGRVEVRRDMGSCQCGDILVTLTIVGPSCELWARSKGYAYEWKEYNGPAKDCRIPYGAGRLVQAIACAWNGDTIPDVCRSYAEGFVVLIRGVNTEKRKYRLWVRPNDLVRWSEAAVLHWRIRTPGMVIPEAWVRNNTPHCLFAVLESDNASSIESQVLHTGTTSTYDPGQKQIAAELGWEGRLGSHNFAQ